VTQHPAAGGADPHGPTPERIRRRRYFMLMGTCLVLLFLSWVVLPRFSMTASVVLSVIAMVIPPVAAIVANWNTGFGPEADPPDPPVASPPGAPRPAEPTGTPSAPPRPAVVPALPPRPRGSGEDRNRRPGG